MVAAISLENEIGVLVLSWGKIETSMWRRIRSQGSELPSGKGSPSYRTLSKRWLESFAGSAVEIATEAGKVHAGLANARQLRDLFAHSSAHVHGEEILIECGYPNDQFRRLAAGFHSRFITRRLPAEAPKESPASVLDWFSQHEFWLFPIPSDVLTEMNSTIMPELITRLTRLEHDDARARRHKMRQA